MRALRVCSFESRRSVEMRSLIERHGGVATVVAAMREAPLESNAEAFTFADAMLAGQVDLVVFLTGVGASALLDVVETRVGREPFLAALRSTAVAVRGPKPAAVLRQWDVPIAIRAPEPNTWRELAAAIVQHGPIAKKRIAVQEYGKSNEEFYRELVRNGAEVVRVPVYRWVLPEDTSRLRAAIRDTIAGAFDVLLFTTAQQLNSVLEVADATGDKDAWRAAARRCVIGSIGPTASETIVECGLPVDVEANPTKMGQLVRAAIDAAPVILSRKRATS